ncbi:MAG: DUF5615 family PIN-like protein [Ginsengibacter sp.]
MKILANENFPYASINYLRSKGFDILSIGMDNPSIKDSEIMSIAINIVAIVLDNLAQLLQSTNRLQEAEPLMRRSLVIFIESLGIDHPNT